MCGRFVLLSAGERLVERYQEAETSILDARYHIAPTYSVAAIRALPADDN
jgi:putative SOS response-associated peptidase YedK